MEADEGSRSVDGSIRLLGAPEKMKGGLASCRESNGLAADKIRQQNEIAAKL